MSDRIALARRIVAVAIAGLLTALPALADKPPWAGGGKKYRHGESADSRTDRGHERDKHGDHRHARFHERDRVVVREYYVEDHRRGHCPPGLAKKHNGCMPPGQAKKKWKVGQPLPRGVAYYELPPALVVKIGAPPPGHRYVRVAGDILLIAVGTSIIVDAIRDLGRL